jgi:hypothetical protein
MHTDERAVQCPNEKCRNDFAYWYQLQIRSADEPMTAFYKVGFVSKSRELSLTNGSAPNVRKSGENEFGLFCIAYKEFGSIRVHGNIPNFLFTVRVRGPLLIAHLKSYISTIIFRLEH